MGVVEDQVLLHPLRMRVVVALGSDALCTKDIHARIPDVAQASLYRAVSRLETAGVIEVVAVRRRGGAVERIYRAASGAGGQSEAAHTRVEKAARALANDGARLAGGAAQEALTLIDRHVVRLTPERAATLRADLQALVAGAVADQRDDGEPVAVTVAVVRAL